MNDLPQGWLVRQLGEIAEVVGGVTKDSKKQSDPRYVEVPYLRVANVQRGYLDLSNVTTIRVPPDTAKRLELRRGDVLLNEGGDRDKLGRGWVWEDQIPGCIHQNHVFRARIRNGAVKPKWLAYYANELGRDWFDQHAAQTTNLASISLSKIKSLPVPVPPGEEQRRLLELLEDHLSRLDSGLAGLESAAARLDALTAAYLADLAPTSPPNGWQMTTIGSIASLIRNGIFASRPSNDDSGVPILRISAVKNGEVDLTDRKYVTGVDQAIIDRYALVSGDLLFTRYNGSRRLVGRCGVVPEHDGPILHPDKLIRVVISPAVADSRFIAYQMETLRVRAYFEPRIRTTAGQSGVSGADVRGAPIVLPPLDEQRRLVQLTEDRLAEIRRLRGQLARTRRAHEVLRRALIHAAFTGQLTERTQVDVEELIGG